MQFNGFVLTEKYTVAATPAAKSFALGYIPGAVKATVISGTNEGKSIEWNDQMTDGTCLFRTLTSNGMAQAGGVTPSTTIAFDETAHANLDADILTLNASPGTTQYTEGFTLGLLSGFNSTAGDVIVVESFRAAK